MGNYTVYLDAELSFTLNIEADDEGLAEKIATEIAFSDPDYCLHHGSIRRVDVCDIEEDED